MNKFKQISLILFLAFISLEIKAQLPPWTVVPTSVSQTIVLETANLSDIGYDNTPAEIGDAVGVFYMQGAVETCAGYLQLDGVSKSFLIYGNDAVDNGLQPAEAISLKFWKKSKNCVLYTTTLTTTDDFLYSTGGYDTIITANFDPAVVNYPQDYYCRGNPTVLPIQMQIAGTSFANLSVSISPAGLLGYNSGTGSIEDFNPSAPGTYSFTIVTADNVCIRNNPFVVTLGSQIKSTPTISTSQPNCSINQGEVILDTATILKGVKPYNFALLNTSSGISTPSLSGTFSSLMVDSYELIIQDAKFCADTFAISIVTNPINCNPPEPTDSSSAQTGDVLTPLSSNSYNELYLPWTGEIKIYNSIGQLVQTLVAPTIWDGRDQNGQYVQTGAYFLYTDGKKKKEVTVLY